MKKRSEFKNITFTIIAINTVVWLTMCMLWLLEMDLLLIMIYHVTVFDPLTFKFFPWTLITHMFQHADFFHLVGNMSFLMLCGFDVEREYGSVNFLMTYMLCGVVGGIATWLLCGAGLLGASAAISGIMALKCLMLVDNGDLPYKWLTLGCLVFAEDLLEWFILVLTGEPVLIGYCAHIFGAFTGVVIHELRRSPSYKSAMEKAFAQCYEMVFAVSSDGCEEKVSSDTVKNTEQAAHNPGPHGDSGFGVAYCLT